MSWNGDNKSHTKLVQGNIQIQNQQLINDFHYTFDNCISVFSVMEQIYNKLRFPGQKINKRFGGNDCVDYSHKGFQLLIGQAQTQLLSFLSSLIIWDSKYQSKPKFQFPKTFDQNRVKQEINILKGNLKNLLPHSQGTDTQTQINQCLQIINYLNEIIFSGKRQFPKAGFLPKDKTTNYNQINGNEIFLLSYQAQEKSQKHRAQCVKNLKDTSDYKIEIQNYLPHDVQKYINKTLISHLQKKGKSSEQYFVAKNENGLIQVWSQEKFVQYMQKYVVGQNYPSQQLKLYYNKLNIYIEKKLSQKNQPQ